jgi:hypothetical protein
LYVSATDGSDSGLTVRAWLSPNSENQMNAGSQDEQVARVLAGFTSHNDNDNKTLPSREGFGVSLDSLAEHVERELWRDRGQMRELNAGRRNCECDAAGATGDERRPVADACGNDLFGEFDFDPRTLGALVDIESEVCLADWVLENPGVPCHPDRGPDRSRVPH